MLPLHMRSSAAWVILPSLLLAACDMGGGRGDGDWKKKDEEFVLAVRVAPPARSAVEDYVHTTATLESDRRVEIFARVDGIVVEKVRDLGERVPADGDGQDALLLGKIDDRDLYLALREAEIMLQDKRGRIQELTLARKQARQEQEQAEVTKEETEAAFQRAESGVTDGTFSIEEHDRAKFARNFAAKRVLTQQVVLEKAEVALELGKIAIEHAETARDRAEVAKEKASIRAPFAGVVSFCDLQQGERVRVGDHLFTIEDPNHLVVYAQIPVRQAMRVEENDHVRISSTAAPDDTEGRVLVVAPTVDRNSGTITVKIGVTLAAAFRPGLYVSLDIVVDTREDALVVPKTAVLHDDEDGAYLYVIEQEAARRVLVKTGFARADVIEIVEGIEETTRVVVEGQDTLTDGAKVNVQDA